MSVRRTIHTMNSSRPRTSVEATRKSRHAPRIQQDNVSRTQTIHGLSGLTHSNYALPSVSPDFYTEMPTWTDSFYPGTDNHMPVFSVDPNDLTRPPYWDPLHTKYDGDLSSASSAASAKSCISPPMAEAQMMHADMYQLPEDRFDYFPDPWLCRTMPITPPAEPLTDMFGNIKNDPMDFSLPEPATECEYIGVSQLQFARSLCSFVHRETLADSVIVSRLDIASPDPFGPPPKGVLSAPHQDPHTPLSPRMTTWSASSTIQGMTRVTKRKPTRTVIIIVLMSQKDAITNRPSKSASTRTSHRDALQSVIELTMIQQKLGFPLEALCLPIWCHG